MLGWADLRAADIPRHPAGHGRFEQAEQADVKEGDLSGRPSPCASFSFVSLPLVSFVVIPLLPDTNRYFDTATPAYPTTSLRSPEMSPEVAYRMSSARVAPSRLAAVSMATVGPNPHMLMSSVVTTS